MSKLAFYGTLSAIALFHFSSVHGSVGDMSWTFHKCLRGCEGRSCSRISDENYRRQQPFYLRWLGWSCSDECDYQCMWRTVDAFQMDGSGVPQFHGKWPFVRLLGIQEPASVLFSLLNGLVHVMMITYFRRKVSSRNPMYYAWHVYAGVAINAWFWSTVFHSRDTPFTEMMDYVCAISLVFYSFIALIIRVLSTENTLRVALCTSPLCTLFVYHVYYLMFVNFDYGYNMNVNIAIGGLNASGWIIWCYQVRHNQPYVWKAAVTILLLSFLVLLELGDFPPVFWTFDAHSLWHAGTIPLPLLWYRFLVDDCTFIVEQRKNRLPVNNRLFDVSDNDKKKL